MDLLRLIDRLTDNVYYQYNSLLKKNASIIFPTGTCLPFQKKIFLTVNGDILPCERIDQKYILGHVTSEKVDLDLDAIGVALQPVVHDEIADRESDDSGDDN